MGRATILRARAAEAGRKANATNSIIRFDLGLDERMRDDRDPAGDVRKFLSEGLKLILTRFWKHAPEVSPYSLRSKRKASEGLNQAG